MKNSDWYEKNHEKELKTLGALVKRIMKGVFYITSSRIDKELVGNGYRFTMYLKEKKK